MGEGKKGEECFHGKSENMDGWWCLFACFLEEGLEEGFEGKKGEIVRFGNSMKTLRFCLRNCF